MYTDETVSGISDDERIGWQRQENVLLITTAIPTCSAARASEKFGKRDARGRYAAKHTRVVRAENFAPFAGSVHDDPLRRPAAPPPKR